MIMARPALLTPVNPGTVNQTGPQVYGRATPMTHTEWLASIKRGDLVRIRNGDFVMQPAMVTDETPCYVFVGKLKFRRRDGWQVSRQSSCVYRMKLRLVRTELDPG